MTIKMCFSDPAYSAELLGAAITLYDFADSYRDYYTNAIPDAGNYYP